MKRFLVRVGIGLLALEAGWAQAPSPGSGATPEWMLPQRRVTVTYWDAVDGPRNDLMTKTVIPAYTRMHVEVAKEFTMFLTGADPKQALDQAADEYAAAYR